ncbi:penicillin acylase family protein [Rudanella lutea]|uniref:penicillin acylase family protein n=1 Tax=Rudanella lutea TaxID=451374 RepID=UPI00035C4BFE|nr:penicillin acylase family protein [Rudanella lutea]
MRVFRAILICLLAVGLVWALNRPWGPAPAFGPFLSPFTGFWQNAERASITEFDQEVEVEGTAQPVTVRYDEYGVPHIFAQNDADAYFAQGYVTARDRLWQMEFQTHAAAGRLTEIVGERALELDRFNRRMGMGFGAERAVKMMLEDPTSRAVVEAYTAGINAYIAGLKPANYPIEYKMLGYAPEPWTPIKCAYLLKLMTSTLAMGADDLRMTNILRKYGPDVVADLFPDYPTLESPIIPEGTKWDFKPLPVPATPTDAAMQRQLLTLTARSFEAGLVQNNPAIGSNNWAVGGQKSATGYPILANDPHLTLSLPSIWYQVQLVTPTMNVCGVSLPGSPGVIIGFNQKVAWGVTNVGADVLDFYTIKFKDATQSAYWHDNQWKPTTMRIERYKVKGKPDVLDTVRYTHHGPVVYATGEKALRPNIPTGHAARWIAHEAANDLRCFYLLNRANNYDDYRKALMYYAAPAQNFVFASVDKDIAISPNGKYPLKWKNQGKLVLDGSNPAHDWQGWIPADQNPLVKNPPRNFVSSANQFSTDRTYPYYLNWQFAPAERGRRINERLTAMTNATADSLRMLQNDNLNLRASDALPTLLPLVQTQSLQGDARLAYETVSKWSRRNDPDEIGPSIFTLWTEKLLETIWKDELDGGDTLPMRYPSFDRTLLMLQREPTARWFDNTATPTRETINDVVTASFKAACDSLTRAHGPLSPAWAWAKHKSTDVRHLLPGVDAFSAMDVLNGGGGTVVNATTARTGPSWRMVVALGPKPKGYGVYPGGQSGNPGSPAYQNLIETWREGKLNELVYLQTATEQHPKVKQTLTLK